MTPENDARKADDVAPAGNMFLSQAGYYFICKVSYIL